MTYCQAKRVMKMIQKIKLSVLLSNVLHEDDLVNNVLENVGEKVKKDKSL